MSITITHYGKYTIHHQKFQVPKMEGFLNLIFGYLACVGEDSSILGTVPEMFGEYMDPKRAFWYH